MIEGGTDGAEAGGGDITGALVVAAPTLSKGVTTVDEDAATESAKVVNALTLAARVTS